MVSVPVLSVQMVVAEPIVSQAISRRTRQFAFAIFRIASERERATLIGSPSGTTATTITTASITLWRMTSTEAMVSPVISPRMIPRMSRVQKTSTAIEYPKELMMWASASSFCSSGVRVAWSIPSEAAITPISAESPTAPAIIRPLPAVTSAPFSRRSLTPFATGSVSPVKADSSEARSSVETTQPSAGIPSPASSRTRSPTTISREGTETGWPSRTTLIARSSRWALSSSNSLLLRYSLRNAIRVERRTAMTIPMVSSSPSPLMMETRAERATAKRRILMMGSSYFRRYCLQSGSRGGGVIVLTPYFRRISSTRERGRP